MPANLLAGEIGIHAGGRDYLFRPSFRKIAELGDPRQIVDMYNDVQKPDSNGFRTALTIMHHFSDCEPEEAFKLFGFYKECKSGLRYVRGLIPEPNDIQVLACQLMVNALVGVPSKKSGKKAEKFDTMEFVGSAVAHFGMQYSDAWEMTMHEFQAAIKAKFPDSKEDEPVTGDDIDNLWKAIDESRARAENG